MTAIVPSSAQPIADKTGNVTQYWQRFFNNLLGVASPTPIVPVTVTASPFSFTAPSWGSVTVSGGTVSAISIRRNTTTAATGVTAGVLPVAQNDVVVVTYSGLPTMNFIPA